MEKELQIRRLKERMVLGLIGSLTLGLAPFYPEPHLLGKLRWIMGGATGMKAMDWFDAVLHAAPWIFLAVSIIQWISIKNK